MDFNLTEDQEALASLAEEVFADQSTDERLKKLAQSGADLDTELWGKVADTGLIGAILPEEHGGGGLGMVGLALLLEQQGRFTAQVPLLDTVVYGVLPLLRFGTPDDIAAGLPALLDGSRIVAGALAETGASLPTVPRTTAHRADDGVWHLDGVKRAVPWLTVAGRVLVTAAVDGASAVFLVDTAADGVAVESAPTTAPWASGNLTLTHAVGTPLGPVPGPEVAEWIVDRARVALAAQSAGVCARGVARTVEYVNGREQFGKPLSTKQGVMLRAADAYMDTEAIRVTALEAAWRMDQGEGARREALVARWYASESGKRVVHACQHLHGGMGADIDHPIHRHFLWGRQIDVTLGSGIQQLAELGRLIAHVPSQGGDR